MKTLIITAHPSSKGFTHQIAKTYKKAKESLGVKVELMNLYDKKWKQDFLEFENMREITMDKTSQEIQKKIKESQEIIFVAPLWWTDVPAIMKNFIDINFSSGFAFKYDKKGKQHPLLKDKKARIFMTCDAPSWIYKILLSPTKMLWKIWRLGFCGIKLESFKLFGEKNKQSEEQLQKYLKEVEAIAKK